jgi:hypothetical protein
MYRRVMKRTTSAAKTKVALSATNFLPFLDQTSKAHLTLNITLMKHREMEYQD